MITYLFIKEYVEKNRIYIVFDYDIFLSLLIHFLHMKIIEWQELLDIF